MFVPWLPSSSGKKDSWKQVPLLSGSLAMQMLTLVSSRLCTPARSHTSQLGSLGSSSSHLVSIAWCWSPELHEILPILSVSLALKCWINHNVVKDTLSHRHSESMHSPPPHTCFHSWQTEFLCTTTQSRAFDIPYVLFPSRFTSA